MTTNLLNVAALHPGRLSDADVWALSRAAWLITGRCDPLADVLRALSTDELVRRSRMANDPSAPPLECKVYTCAPWLWETEDIAEAIIALFCVRGLSDAGLALRDRLTMLVLASLRGAVARSDGQQHCRPTAPL